MSKNGYGSSSRNGKGGAFGISYLKETITGLFKLSLYRNAIFLMLNAGLYALTGFFFWIAAARLYPAETVGLASSALAAIVLVSLLSTLGLDYGLLRFLPTAGVEAGEMMNTSYTIGGSITVIASLVYVAGLGIWSPALLPIRNNLLYFGGFVLFAFVNTIQTFNSQCFIAARQSRFTMIQGAIISLLRFVPLFILANSFRDFGIVASWGICLILSVLVAFTFFQPRAYPGSRLRLQIKKEVVSRMLRFSFANYIGNILWSIPGLLLPLMVVNKLSAAENAYFYIAWAIAGIVFMIPTAVGLSMFVEASRDEGKLALEMKRSLTLIFLLLALALIVLLPLSRTFLRFFGKAYSDNALQLLWILCVSAIPMSLNFVYITIQRVDKKMASVIWLSAFLAVGTIVSSYLLLPVMGIKGAGIGTLASQCAAALFTLPYLWGRLHRKTDLPIAS